jgi:hypothetical protein
MRILITAEEAIDKGIWENVCDIVGYNYYAVNEGMDPDTEISLTEDQARQLGLIPTKSVDEYTWDEILNRE